VLKYIIVPFEQVCDLVSKRSVIVKDGFAYVPSSFQTELIANEFKDRLRTSLETTARALPRMDEDDRLMPVLHSISKQYLSAAQYTNTYTDGKTLTADEAENLSPLFPPCMLALHSQLKSNGHLKHQGRMQFGLFLKGIGLPLDEALIYWRKAFRNMSDDQYQKGGYAYNIRHNYGMEGKRTDYTPYSCVKVSYGESFCLILKFNYSMMIPLVTENTLSFSLFFFFFFLKIITTNAPGPGVHLGCPFRHYSPDNLRNTLLASGCPEGSVSEVLKLARDQHYQLACTRYFELKKYGSTHGKKNEGSGNRMIETIQHPNEYFSLAKSMVTESKDTQDDKMDIDSK